MKEIYGGETSEKQAANDELTIETWKKKKQPPLWTMRKKKIP